MRIAALLEEAGLAGRGGAAFPTATKVAAAHRSRADLVVNACDGELGAMKDAWVVEHHLDELVRGASRVVGRRRRVTFAAHRGSATAHRLAEAGLDVLEAPARYVSSEETSLISLLHGGLARPMTRREPFVGGGRDTSGRQIRPTLVLNAETVWRIDQIAERGPAWFRSHGTPDEPGPRLVAVSGAVHAPGVVETMAGVPVREIVARAGVRDPATEAVLVGGLGGAFLTAPEALAFRWTGADLARVGAAIGPGTIEVVDPAECPLDVVDGLLAYASGESAGQCGPCMFGVPAVAGDWHEVATTGDEEAFTRMLSRVGLLPGRGACRFPDGIASLVRSALRVFGPHVRAHLSGSCPPVLRRPVGVPVP